MLVLNPRLGEAAALLIELPVMLALSWIVCGRVIARFAVAPRWSDRIGMGAAAFVLLLLAEFAVGVLLLGLSPAQHLAAYAQPLAALGLAAQALFALFPLIQLVTLGDRGGR